MSDTDPVSPERLARAEALIDGAGRVPLPYPSREATDLTDGALLYALELLQDPQWLARNVLPPDPEGWGDDG